MKAVAGRCALLLALLSTAAPWAAADELQLRSDTFWPRWQARLGVTTGPSQSELGTSLQGARVLGDYYFTGPGFGTGAVAGGFRATSGVFAGSRSDALSTPTLPSSGGATVSLSARPGLALAAPTPDGADGTVPYLGLGYTGMSLRGGWGFTADIGLMGAGVRFGRTPTGTQSHVDELLRELRMTPVVQLGVTYSF